MVLHIIVCFVLLSFWELEVTTIVYRIRYTMKFFYLFFKFALVLSLSCVSVLSHVMLDAGLIIENGLP